MALGWAEPADRAILAVVRVRREHRADGKPRRLVTAARDVMALGGDAVRLLALGVCLATLLADGRPAAAGLLATGYAAARGALFAIKRVVRRPRPDAEGHGTVTYTSSFPSGHTFMAVVLYLAAALLLPAPAGVTAVAAVAALVIAALVGAIRVAFGVHWPSDVLAGWTAGIAWTAGLLLLGSALGVTA